MKNFQNLPFRNGVGILLLNKETQTKLEKKDITDHDRYVLNHKIAALKEIRV